MKYAEIEDSIVLRLASHPRDNYVEVDDSVFPGFAQNLDGSFTQPPIAFAVLIDNLRRDRDEMLRASDWTALADSALISEVSAKWKLYRQRLRDLPSGLNTPAKVKAAKWPAKPV